jgi:hypothetical protein
VEPALPPKRWAPGAGAPGAGAPGAAEAHDVTRRVGQAVVVA